MTTNATHAPMTPDGEAWVRETYGVGSLRHPDLLSPTAKSEFVPWGSGAPPTKVYGMTLFVRPLCSFIQSEIVNP